MPEQLDSVVIGLVGVLLPIAGNVICNRRNAQELELIEETTRFDRNPERFYELVNERLCYPLLKYTGINIAGAFTAFVSSVVCHPEASVSGAGFLGASIGCALSAVASFKKASDYRAGFY